MQGSHKVQVSQTELDFRVYLLRPWNQPVGSQLYLEYFQAWVVQSAFEPTDYIIIAYWSTNEYYACNYMYANINFMSFSLTAEGKKLKSDAENLS